MLSDLNEDSKGAMEYFGVGANQGPLIVIQENDGKKYLTPKVEPDQIATFLKDCLEGSLEVFVKSEPIPEVHDEPVKKVVVNNVKEFVNSGKYVLLEFYAPWGGDWKSLEPILNEVVVTLEKGTDVVIAKMDATTNDVPSEFVVQGFPTLYFSSASGKVTVFDGNRTAEFIIDFINSNKESTGESKEPSQAETESPKDEL